MKKIFSLSIFLTLFLHAFSQKISDVFYVFKSDWSVANNLDDATYFMQVVQQDDTTFVCRYYQKFGPMVKQESYSDTNLTKPNGFFAWYTPAGRIDSAGDVKDGKKDGQWYHYFDSANAQQIVYYADAKRVKTVDYRMKKEYYADGTVKDIEDKKDTAGDAHIYEKADYPGGEKAWTKYLFRNINIPVRFQDVIRNGTCEVVVLFSIDEEGNPVDIQLGKSCEWSADAEAVRVVKRGGKWKPATVDGRKVIYRQRQAIAFRVSG